MRILAPLPQVLSDGTNSYLAGLGRIGEYGASGWAYHHPDALGSVRLLTNSGGSVTGEASYTPFGEVMTSSLQNINEQAPYIDGTWAAMQAIESLDLLGLNEKCESICKP